MKVICTTDSNILKNFTLRKEYEVIDTKNNCYLIKENDLNEPQWVYKLYFKKAPESS